MMACGGFGCLNHKPIKVPRAIIIKPTITEEGAAALNRFLLSAVEVHYGMYYLHIFSLAVYIQYYFLLVSGVQHSG